MLAGTGYTHAAGIAALVAQQADVCVRLHPAFLRLRDKQGRPFPLLQALKKLQRAGKTASWQVWVVAGKQRIAGRICAIRKSEQTLERAPRKRTRKQQQGKMKATAATREYGCYMLVFTTLTRRQATTRQVLECYRARWRIELTFKRLKSMAHWGHVPKHDDRSRRGWLYGKLFVALLSQKLARVGGAISPWGYGLVEETEDTQPLA